MQAILTIEPNEVDDRLLRVIKELLSEDVEITVKNQRVELKAFDKALQLDEMISEFQKAGYCESFIGDLKTGFATSEIYIG
jgi:hypothetical protein